MRGWCGAAVRFIVGGYHCAPTPRGSTGAFGGRPNSMIATVVPMSYRSAPPAVVLAAVAAVLLAAGSRVRVRRDVALIAGYDPRRVHDADGLARWVGGWVLALGGATLAAAAAFAWPGVGPWLGRPYGALVLATAVAIVLGAGRYTQ